MARDSELDTQAARARCEAATEEPWAVDGLNRLFIVAPKHPKHGIITDFGPRATKGHPERDANAEFIARARSDLPAALDALEEAQGNIERPKGVSCCHHHPDNDSSLAVVLEERSKWDNDEA
jgi:hypothetical protein